MVKHTGCIHEGGDDRLLHWLICPIQRFLSWESTYEPVSILVGIIPPYLAINFPVPFSKLTKYKVRKNIHFRIGFRYDFNAKAYLLSAALKDSTRAIFY